MIKKIKTYFNSPGRPQMMYGKITCQYSKERKIGLVYKKEPDRHSSYQSISLDVWMFYVYIWWVTSKK